MVILNAGRVVVWGCGGYTSMLRDVAGDCGVGTMVHLNDVHVAVCGGDVSQSVYCDGCNGG